MTKSAKPESVPPDTTNVHPITHQNGAGLAAHPALVSGIGDRAAARDGAADVRDALANMRDQAAIRRDEDADERDLADQRSEADAKPPFSLDTLRRLHAGRALAAADRGQATEDRHRARGERDNAKADRVGARTDRDHISAYAKDAHLDELTGAYRRGPGLLELEREIFRANRTKSALTVTFVDVDHLKWVNDSDGHLAGDQVLIGVVRALRSNLRPYDPILRYGGDEFVCVLAGLTAAQAAERMTKVNAELQGTAKGSVTAGFADLQPDDTVESLLARADQDLCETRHRDRPEPLAPPNEA